MQFVYIIIVVALVGGGYYLYTEQANVASDSTTNQEVPEIDPRTENTNTITIPSEDDHDDHDHEHDDDHDHDHDDEMKSEEVAEDDAENSDDEMSETGAIKEFNLDSFNFGYSMEEITVTEGDTVTINLTSSDGFHDWVVDEFGAATEKIREGGNTSVTFVADAAGTYEFYCSVGNHRAQGMVGTLIVE